MPAFVSALSLQPRRTAATRRFSFGRRILRVARKMALVLQIRAERRHLMRLDHATLKDMGFNKGQAENEASRPFWDIPVDRLR